MTKLKSDPDHPSFGENDGADDEIEIIEVVGFDAAAETAGEAATDLDEAEADPDEIVLDLDEPGPDVSDFPPVADPTERWRHSKAAVDERERYLRLQADFENFKRRAERESAELERHAASRLLSRLLPVLDNFERAISSASGGVNDAALLDGVVLIFRQLLDELRREGLSAIDSAGQPFDPQVHEAVATEFSEDLAPNMVIEELQRGYRLGKKILRPSLVRVTLDPRERNEYDDSVDDEDA